MARFKIYAEYGYESECLLEEFDHYQDAVKWLNGYTRGGDFGGYSVIEIAEFAEDGEYIVHKKVEAEYLED